MTILDQRLTQTEDRLSSVLAHSRNLVLVPPQTASSQFPVSATNPYFRGGGAGHAVNDPNDIVDAGGDYSYGDESEDEGGDSEEDCADDNDEEEEDVDGEGSAANEEEQKRWAQYNSDEPDNSDDEHDPYDRERY